VSGTSTTNNGVNGHSTSAYGVLGFSANSYGVAGESTSSYGVYGTSGSSIAIYGASSQSIAIKASVPKTNTTSAIYGIIGNGNQFDSAPGDIAVVGDVQGGDDAVGGFTDTGIAGIFKNNETGTATVYVENDGSGKNGQLPDVVIANSPFGTCGFGGNGDMTCTGQVKSLVTTASARRVETYSVQSSENWLEDYGSETLKNGIATVKLDVAFLDAANTGVAYHVFLTPKGDANTLYVTNETASGFEVRESGKGKSNIAFDYRIVAKRRGHEGERLVDVTGKLEADLQRARAKVHTRPVKESGESNP
jgi:hypothetical protein